MGKGRENCCFVFPPSTKRETMYFHFVVVHMHVQSCFFAKQNLLVHCRSRCRRRRRCLSSIVYRGCRMPILSMGITGREMRDAGFGVRDGDYGIEGTVGSE